jgi:CheY-like chemotaxis protein
MQENETPRTVLLVEDNPGDIFLLQRACARIGVTDHIQVARDGEEAFAYLIGLDEFADRAKYPWPAFLITDLKMPQVDGLELLKHLRNTPQCRDLPVFILCGSATDDEISEAAQLGVIGVLFKPVRIEDFDGVVQTMFQQGATLRRAVPAPVQTVQNKGTVSTQLQQKL